MKKFRCDVCSHPARVAIERMLLKSQSLHFVADRYGMTNDMLKRHKDLHMLRDAPAVVADNQRNAATVIHNKMDPVILFEEHDECILEAKALIQYCLGEKDPHTGWIREPDTRGWALGIREWRGCLDQKNRMLGLYDQVDPRLQRAFAARIIQVVSMALESFPDAKQQVLAAIDEVEKGDT